LAQAKQYCLGFVVHQVGKYLAHARGLKLLRNFILPLGKIARFTSATLQFIWQPLANTTLVWGKFVPIILFGIAINTVVKAQSMMTTAIDSADYAKESRKKLLELESQGYPFAFIRADSIEETVGQIRIRQTIVKGSKFTWDSLKIQGTALVNEKWLASMLHIKHGSTYSSTNWQNTERYLRTLPYITIKDKGTLRFAGTEAFPVLMLDKRKSNQADGIVGFLPNQQAQGKILINGEVNLLLNNLFKSGKSLQASWRSISDANQKIDLVYKHTGLAGKPIELIGQFSLLKQDSTFLSKLARLDLNYVQTGGKKLGLFISDNSSSIIGNSKSRDTNLISNTHQTQYGLIASINTLSDYYYPRKGMKGIVEIAMGNKQLSNLPKDSKIETSSIQGQVKLNLESYFSITKNQVIMVRLQSQAMLNNNLQINELMRVGGLSTLRGFNENTFFAAQYGVGTLEYRLFTEASTYFTVFADQGWLRYQTYRGSAIDTPAGIGIGANLAIASGIFNISYAIGRTNSSSFRFQNAKIHFGVIARF